MISPGLVSVTFRQLPSEAVVDLACQAGLSGIEWGGDIHVPHGDLAQARRVGDLTRSAGLHVVSYGSYYRVWPREPAPFESVLDTALALGAPTIRVWAGKTGSLQTQPQDRSAVVAESQRIAGLASQAGVTIAFEFHADTLTDTDESAVALLESANQPNLRCYWQPRVSASIQQNQASLATLAPWLHHLHVFHWNSTSGGQYERRPLQEGAAGWSKYLAAADRQAGDRYAMLEFTQDDSPQAFLNDAAVLVALCSQVSVR